MTAIRRAETNMQDLKLLQSKWGWLLAAGVIMAALGMLALGNLLLATVVSIFFVGAMMLLAGIAQIVYAFQVRGRRQFLVWLVIGVLYVLAGIVAFANPLLTSTFFTFVMAFGLVVAGGFRLLAGISARPRKGWGFLATAGVLTAAVGLILLSGWPANSLWFIGTLLGIDLIFNGVALATFSIALKRAFGTAGQSEPRGDDAPPV